MSSRRPSKRKISIIGQSSIIAQLVAQWSEAIQVSINSDIELKPFLSFGPASADKIHFRLSFGLIIINNTYNDSS